MTREGERELVKVEHVNGGDGYIVREAMVTSEEVGEACKMYAKIHLDPGCEVGYHYHHGETESYFILTGHGTYDDNGEKQPANPGDLFLCKDGDAHGIKNFKHYKIAGYPNDVAKIVSDDGYGKNEFIKTTRPLVVVTAPGPGSGKMATCLSQLYHEYKHGVKAGYAKFETFPIWNIPLKHPVNLAYEAATADLNDVNMIDPFHLEAYGKTTVNYNRDIEIFPVLNAMFELIAGESPYKSPTDMGVNMAGNCIVDDEACRYASNMEIIRRYYKCLCDQKRTGVNSQEIYKIELLMNQAGITPSSRPVVNAALEKSAKSGDKPAVAIELEDGTIVTGKTGDLLGAASSALLNALKQLAGIDDSVDLLSPESISPIQTLKTNYLGSRNPRLHTDEILIALSSSVVANPLADKALKQIPKLYGCDVHSTVILSSVDKDTFKRLGMNLTCEPAYEEEKRFHKN